MHRSLRSAYFINEFKFLLSFVAWGAWLVACSSSPSGDGEVAFGPGAPNGIYGAGDAASVSDAGGAGDAAAPDSAPDAEEERPRVCLPCSEPEDCAAGSCVAVDGVRLCLDPCADDGSCVGGLSCVGTEAGQVCAPAGGVCPCEFASRGQVRPCAAESATGVCAGEALCDFIDGWVCSVQAPAPEQCNLLDDDCDGEVDEDFKIGAYYFGPESCGACGTSCVDVPHGTAACSLETPPASCRVVSCEAGYASPDGLGCEPVGGLACVPCASDEGCPGGACELVDGESMCLPVCGAGCPAGYTCAAGDGLCWPTTGTCACRPTSLGLVVSCTQDNDFGSCVGTSTCLESGFSPCDASVPAPEECNGADDDCNGVVDEALPPDQTCVATLDGVGTCVGLLVCKGAAGWECTAEAPTPEVCDTLDNDCDGVVDDGFRDPVSGLYTTDANCGACGIDCALLVAPHAVGHCGNTAPLPTCGLVCDGGWVDADSDDTNGCECPYQGPDDPPDGVDQNCDGIDGMPDKAVFVSVTGSDAAPGTPAQPVRTVARGLEMAKLLSRPHVYVTGGQFEGGAVIHGGVRVFCGFDLTFAARQPAVNESVLLAAQASATAPGTVSAVFPAAPTAPTGMDGCTVIGGVAAGEGEASYAIYVRNGGPQVSFTANRVIAGTGGPGPSGPEGAHGDVGAPGVGGKGAYDVGGGMCVAASGLAGGAGGARTCGAVEVSGGPGGQSSCPDYNEFAGGSDCPAFESQSPKGSETGKSGLPSGGGGGGGVPGSDALQSALYDGKTCSWDVFNCGYCHVALGGTDGKDGKQGTAGEQGSAGAGASSALGAVQGGLWAGAAGGVGGGGKPGAGGGGGGAGGGVEAYSCQDASGGSDIGGSGGGGGSGACGGAGGTGGGAGGAAFGVFLTWTSAVAGLPVIAGNTLVTGKGGVGGKGGAGGVGGVGGYGGTGGADGSGDPVVWCAGEGGNGGHGGSGGSGGGGGGGAGGPAIGVGIHAPAGTVVTPIEQGNTFELSGSGGPGGAGGASKGKAGVAGPAGQLAGVAVIP